MPIPNPTPLVLLGALALAAAAVGYQGFRPGPPPPFDDHDLMMKKLGVGKLRRGPDPNAPSNSDESLANPYKDTMPDALTMKDGTKVATPAQWAKRRKEIAEDFEREIYGRVPKKTPKVTWEVVGISAGESGGIPTITKTLIGHVDNRSYPKAKVDIQASFTVPAHATDKVPIMIEFGFGFGGFPGRPRQGTPWTQQAIEHGWGYG